LKSVLKRKIKKNNEVESSADSRMNG